MKKTKLSREEFIRLLAASGAGVLLGGGLLSSCEAQAAKLAGELLGSSHKMGHLIREIDFAQTVDFVEKEIVIVGAGVAGLAAAWELRRLGVEDFWVLELEAQAGGKSASGRNEISAYPWGAHYLPLPGMEQPELLDFLQSIDVIQGRNAEGFPIFDPKDLCHAPHERLYIHGKWQRGLIPNQGLSEQEKGEMSAFLDLMDAYKKRVGKDGKKAFTIPLDRSSQDTDLLALDQISMADFLAAKGWISPSLHWYVNYCCRDDYGSSAAETSAWAGIHYFAARRGEGVYAKSHDVLSWPEGNARLIRGLAEGLEDRLKCNNLVWQISQEGEDVLLRYLDTQRRELKGIRCKNVIFCGPQFVAKRIIQNYKHLVPTYAPWITANISLGRVPEGLGAPLSWDNVGYDSPSLGYINARHQEISLAPAKQTVLTWYYPLSDQLPKEGREKLLDSPLEYWQAFILADLEKMHKGISKEIKRIDVWRWGHGMVRPVPDYIWSEARSQANKSIKNIHFAHSDLSGISIFEEAFYQGIQIVQAVI